jgi:hypothetical protein
MYATCLTTKRIESSDVNFRAGLDDARARFPLKLGCKLADHTECACVRCLTARSKALN